MRRTTSENTAVADVLGGQLPLMFSSLPVSLPLSKAGKLRALAITSPQRSPLAPEYPTIAESGIPGFETATWVGLHAPGGINKDLIARINADVIKILNLPNTREKLGAAAATMKPDEFDDEGRAFVPKSPDVLGATKLLLAGEQQSLKLTAPSVEGEYEYFCTYPGHYQVMWARLIITKDVDGYLQAHPDVPLPAPSPNPLEDGGKEPKHDHGR